MSYFQRILKWVNKAPRDSGTATLVSPASTPPNSVATKTPDPYIYQPQVARVSFAEGVTALQSQGYRVVPSPVDNTSTQSIADIQSLAETVGIHFTPYTIDIEAYRTYFQQAGYDSQYGDYYRGNQPEKSLEHYLALQWLGLTAEDVFIDLASEHSPVPAIYAKLTGATTYSQDIMYAPGIQGNQIGGDACAMPVPDGFATKATLTCSIEHFEGDGDTRLFQELARVLRPGGQVCVVPFYIYREAAAQTDPTISVPAAVQFDADATLYCAQGWNNRHGRFYSPQSFLERILNPVSDRFKFDFYYLQNPTEVDASVYVRFAFVATRI
ncbi:class I SAM-dependent methyltransferase [Alkalinema pantanalense CENA528]|uniref:class I SAM-dependent methyltransferase n=1 Tax=Alkalinema pantanalense TaxID=1620705 RepID=UPI003D6F2B98